MNTRNQNQQEYYQKQLADGQLYQDFAVDCCWSILGLAVVQYGSKLYQHQVGESRTGVEIKHDKRYAETGNLYIEVGEKASIRNGEHAASGIERGDNSWLYLIGDYNTIFVFSKRLLQQLHKCGKYEVFEISMKTSRGFLLPGEDAEKYAAQIMYPNAEKKLGKLAADMSLAARELHDLIVKPNGKLQLHLFQGESK